MQRSTMPAVRYLWWTCAALLVAGAGAVYTQGRSAAELHAEAVVDAAAAGRPTPGPTKTLTVSGSAAAPRSGPGITSPGTAISARIPSADTIDVSESVRVTKAITSITLAPPKFDAAGDQFASLAPSLGGVQVTADGQMVPILRDKVDASVQIDLPSPATSVEVRYSLKSAIVRTLPSKAGRALASLTPVVETAASGPVAYVFGGAEIVGVSCPQLGPTAYACAGGVPGRLTVAKSLPHAKSLVLLQVNLPRL